MTAKQSIEGNFKINWQRACVCQLEGVEGKAAQVNQDALGVANLPAAINPFCRAALGAFPRVASLLVLPQNTPPEGGGGGEEVQHISNT